MNGKSRQEIISSYRQSKQDEQAAGSDGATPGRRDWLFQPIYSTVCTASSAAAAAMKTLARGAAGNMAPAEYDVLSSSK